MMSMNLRNIAILNIQGADYCFIINRISKSETIDLIQNIGLNEKKPLKNIKTKYQEQFLKL